MERTHPALTACAIVALFLGALLLSSGPSEQETAERTAEAVRDIGKYDRIDADALAEERMRELRREMAERKRAQEI